MLKNKKNIFVVIIILIIIISLLIFIKTYYKKLNIGQTIIIKSQEQLEKHILDISSYTATIEVTITSNKNENKYIMKQQYKEPNITKQTILEPSNISGLETIYDGNKLVINNTQLNLQTIYENYNYITENQLYLTTFIEDYKNDETKTREETENQIILKTKTKNGNKYMSEKTLFIDKQTAKPIKLEIQDINKNTTVYILYTEIELNSTKKEEIVAFKLNKEIENI